MLPRTCLLVVQLYEPSRSQSNSTDLPACSPTRVIHPTTNLPACSNSQVQARNIRPFPLISSHKSINNMNLPAHINHVFHHQSRTYPLVIQSSISQTKTNTTSHAKHITTAPCHYIITWRSLSTAKKNGSVDRLAVPQHRRAPRHTRLPYFLLSPNNSLYTAKHYTSNVTLLVLCTLIQFLESNNSILKHLETKITHSYTSYTQIYNSTTHVHHSSISTHVSLYKLI